MVNINIWEEAVYRQAERMRPFIEDMAQRKLWAGEEMHWDTIARGPAEYNQAREMFAKVLGEDARSVLQLGFDGSHKWAGGGSYEDWVDASGDLIKALHVKRSQQRLKNPAITGDNAWNRRAMQFDAANTGDREGGDPTIGDQLNYVIANSSFVYHPTFPGEKAVGKLGGRDVYTKFAVAEGEHPSMTQVTTAKEYAKALQPLCDRRYGSGFKVGGTKG